MDLKNLLTIVIPCKNEKGIIQKTLDLLKYQRNITGVNVIVCDSSNDSITYESLIDRLSYNTDVFDLIIILTHRQIANTYQLSIIQFH